MSNARGVGRPKALTPELQEEICRAIEVGAYMETAAAFAGLDKVTFYEWMKRGAKHNRGEKGYENDHIYGEFSNALSRALAKSEMRDVVQIDKHAKKHWQAAAWKLERRFGKRWGRQDKLDIEMSGKLETGESVKDALLEKLSGLISSVNKDKGDEGNATEGQNDG